MGDGRTMTPKAARAFLEKMAGYFELRPAVGEDVAHWSNVYNAENCRIIARMLHQIDACGYGMNTPQPNVDEGDGK